MDALATCDAGQAKWRIVLINRHPSNALNCTVKLGGKSLSGTHRATVLAGDSPDAYNDVGQPNRVIPQTTEVSFTDGHTALPPHSLTILEVDG